MKERFADVSLTNGAYSVSDIGTVRSNPSGRSRKTRPIVMRQSICPAGYRTVVFSVNGKTSCHMVHRLVASAFVPNPAGKPQVNHINGIKTDNRAENLEWVTPAENMRHAASTGLFNQCGERNSGSKLTAENVLEIISMCESGLTQVEVGKVFGVCNRTISKIVRGERWSRALKRHVAA